VCDGSVVLRLEESDDETRSLKRLEHWMQIRKGCERDLASSRALLSF